VRERLEDGIVGEVIEEDLRMIFFPLPPISSAICQAIASPPGPGRGEEDLVSLGRRLLELGDHLLLALHDLVGGSNPFRCRFQVVFRKVLDMTDGGADIILLAQYLRMVLTLVVIQR